MVELNICLAFTSKLKKDNKTVIIIFLITPKEKRIYIRITLLRKKQWFLKDLCIFVASHTRYSPHPSHLIPLGIIFNQWKQRSNSPLLCRWKAEHSSYCSEKVHKRTSTFAISLTAALENNQCIFKYHIHCCSRLKAFSKSLTIFHREKAKVFVWRIKIISLLTDAFLTPHHPVTSRHNSPGPCWEPVPKPLITSLPW